MSKPGRRLRKSKALQKFREYIRNYGQNCTASNEAWVGLNRKRPRGKIRYWTTRGGIRWKG